MNINQQAFARRLASVVIPFLSGVLASQFIALVQVMHSNLKLHKSLELMNSAGYLIVPNQITLPELLTLKAAFWGGTFFSLTVGVFLSLLGIITAQILCSLTNNTDRLWKIILLTTLPLVVWVNQHGFNPAASAYVFIIPILTAWMFVKMSPGMSSRSFFLLLTSHCIILIIIGAFGYYRASVENFTRFRNTILMPAASGQKAIEFYYQYTLYPAQTFKSAEQKTLKVCRVYVPPSSRHHQRLIRTLLNFDYLVLNQAENSDLDIYEQNDRLIFSVNQREYLSLMPDDFFKDPRSAFQKVSAAADTHAAFRQLTLFSLLVSLSIMPYLILYCFIYYTVNVLFHNRIKASVAGLTACLITGIYLIWLLPNQQPTDQQQTMSDQEIQQGITSAVNKERWETLLYIVNQNINIAGFTGYETLLTSHELTDRYLMTKILSNSSSHIFFNYINTLLDDPSPFIVYHALNSMANIPDRRQIPMVIERLRSSNHWYVQMYAYKTLKKLGWRQPLPSTM